ncbi:secreted salivary gland peptide, putative, partial [Ixodes scapularis]
FKSCDTYLTHESLKYFCNFSAEEQCRAPRPTASCGSNASLRYIYFFSNHTNQCEREFGCTKGMNSFEDRICCLTECPYGE